MRAPERWIVRCLAGAVLAAAAGAPSHADVIFSYDATQPITSYAAVVGMVNPNFAYNPATQGAITGINFSIQQAEFENFTPIAASASFNARAVIYQNGQFYTAQAPGTFPGLGAFATISITGLTASSFGLFNLTDTTITDANHMVLGPSGIDMTINPNFSSTGTTIEFGMGGIFGFTCGMGAAGNLSCPFQVQQTVERQDMMYTINDPIMFTDINFADLSNYNVIDFLTASNPLGGVNGSVSFVPEPASLPVFAAALMALIGFARFAPRRLRSKGAAEDFRGAQALASSHSQA